MKSKLLIAVLTLTPAITAANFAEAQTLTTQTLGQYEAPINGNGDGLGLHQTPIGFMKDENFNLIRIRGAFSSMAVGNLISVNVEGSNNYVEVSAEQNNSGDISSELILNGSLDF